MTGTAEDIRSAVVFVARMANEEALRAEAIPSRKIMVDEFVEVNGTAKMRVAGGRALHRRVVVSHAEVASRTFEVIRSRRYGDVRKYTIRVNGKYQIVSSADGWVEIERREVKAAEEQT